MAEDVLVNIEIDSKKAERGIDGLNSRLKENARQTRKLEEELRRLEQEYKAIAAAASKLPSSQVTKLEKEFKKLDRATNSANKQFEKTGDKVGLVGDKIKDLGESGDAFINGAITTSVIAFQKQLQTLGSVLIKGSKSFFAVAISVGALDNALIKIGTGVIRLVEGSLRDAPAAFEAAKDKVNQTVLSIQKNMQLFIEKTREVFSRLAGAGKPVIDIFKNI